MEEFYITVASDAWDEREGPLIVALFAMVVFVPCFIYLFFQLAGGLIGSFW